MSGTYRSIVRRGVVAAAAVCLAAALAGAAPKAAKAKGAPAAAADGYAEVSQKDITFRWKVEGSTLCVVVRAPVKGWIAVGFDPSHMMKDANIVIGYVADGKAVISDEFGDGLISHKPDTGLGGTDDLVAAEGSERDGVTELRFRIPLDSGDAFDKPLVPGREYAVILAAGGKDDLTTIHSVRAKVRIKL